MECTEYWAFGFSDPPPLFLEHSPKSDTQMSPWPLTKSHLDSPLGNNQTYIAAWWKGKKQKQKTYSILYHGPVWITLNSFIWNIKTMKHKPSTKSDSYKCRIIRLLKMNRLYWKTTVFFFSLWMVKQIHKTDSEMWTWLCHLHAPNPTWQKKRR